MKITKLHGRYVTPLDQVLNAWIRYHGSIKPEWNREFEKRVLEIGIVWLPIVDIDRVFKITPKLYEFESVWSKLKTDEEEIAKKLKKEQEQRNQERTELEQVRSAASTATVAICNSCDRAISVNGICGCNRN